MSVMEIELGFGIWQLGLGSQSQQMKVGSWWVEVNGWELEIGVRR